MDIAGPVHSLESLVESTDQLQNNPYRATKTTITANAPTLYIAPVLKVSVEIVMPLASSAPLFSFQLTKAITNMVNKVVYPI